MKERGVSFQHCRLKQRQSFELLQPFADTLPSATLVLMNELVFEVVQEEDGGFVAECLTESIFTQGDSWAELRTNVQEAVQAFCFDCDLPIAIRLHLVRDEVVALG